jgi:glycosyltransferase involved in cell wall biosynthesis
VRILYLCADRGIRIDKYNGEAGLLRSLVGAFSTLGHELLVLTPSPGDERTIGAPVEHLPTPHVLEDLLQDVEQPVPRSARERQRARKRVVHALGHIWSNVVVENEIEAAIDRFVPDFVFERYSPFCVAGVLTCNRLGIPHLLNVHAPLAWEGATFRSQALQEAAELLEDVAFQSSRRIVTNSRQMRDQLLDAGVDGEKIEVVVNGVDLDLFTPDGERRRVAPDDAIVVGFAGSLKAWHGIQVLAEAFAKVAAADSRFHLVVVGDGPLRDEIARVAAAFPGRVTATGAVPLEQVPPWIRGMDIAVAPYPPIERFYFSPLKILDAMACGVANVASDIGQVPELLTHEETGILVPPGDSDALAAALIRLADDAALRTRLGKKAAAEAEERHSWTSRAEEFVSIATRDIPVAAL